MQSIYDRRSRSRLSRRSAAPVSAKTVGGDCRIQMVNVEKQEQNWYEIQRAILN